MLFRNLLFTVWQQCAAQTTPAALPSGTNVKEAHIGWLHASSLVQLFTGLPQLPAELKPLDLSVSSASFNTDHAEADVPKTTADAYGHKYNYQISRKINVASNAKSFAWSSQRVVGDRNDAAEPGMHQELVCERNSNLAAGEGISGHRYPVTVAYQAAKFNFKCPTCHKILRTEGGFMLHWKRYHSGEKLHECSTCPKKFVCHTALVQHERIHTGEQPFECRVCQKKFNQIGNWQKHERLHQGERPYICEHCNHTFSEKATLKIHNRIHTGEKPYQCNRCNKTFGNPNSLRRHKWTHEDAKPYICGYCNRGLSRKYDLIKHIQKCRGRVVTSTVESTIA